MTKTKARILIVEDDQAILKGLTDVLIYNGYSCQGIEDGNQGLELALSKNFDLILLDIMLPGLDGVSICKKVHGKKPHIGIIMLTAKGAESDILDGFKAGADDYIPKPFSIRELLVRLEALLRRLGKPINDQVIQIENIKFNGLTLKAISDNGQLELTRREMDIISYISQNHDRIVSKKELLTHVWNYLDPTVETRTVDIHMLKLKKKIKVLSPQKEFIQTIRGEGYRLTESIASRQ